MCSGARQYHNVSVICTTPTHATSQSQTRAQEISAWFGCRMVERRHRTIRTLFADEGVESLIVADRQPMLYHRLQPEHPLFYHPGMAQQRILSMRRGDGDRLIRCTHVTAGDTILDATFGIGTDSLVFAEAVGPSGSVIGVEASPLLAGLFTYAQHQLPAQYADVQHLMPRIHLHVGNHDEVLAGMASNSVDVVYFDPMFRRAITTDSDLNPARPWANPNALEDSAWQAACRVARRCVVLKERPSSGEFQRFGVHPDKRTHRFAYGVWWKEGAE